MPGSPRRSSDRQIAVTVAVIAAPPRGPVPYFARWVAESTPPGATVLNVGGGCNASGGFPRVRRRAASLIAVDPSARVAQDRAADEQHQMTLEDFALEHPDRFDLVFAVLVLEHVADPTGFTEGVARVHKPGGVFMALTLDRWHYFGFTTWASCRLGLSEWLLRRVRDPGQVEEYHFRTEYRINTIRSISRHLERAGFGDAQFRMWDDPAAYEPYLPGRLRGFATAWSRTSYRLARPNLMGHLALKAVLRS